MTSASAPDRPGPAGGQTVGSCRAGSSGIPTPTGCCPGGGCRPGGNGSGDQSHIPAEGQIAPTMEDLFQYLGPVPIRGDRLKAVWSDPAPLDGGPPAALKLNSPVPGCTEPPHPLGIDTVLHGASMSSGCVARFDMGVAHARGQGRTCRIRAARNRCRRSRCGPHSVHQKPVSTPSLMSWVCWVAIPSSSTLMEPQALPANPRPPR